MTRCQRCGGQVLCEWGEEPTCLQCGRPLAPTVCTLELKDKYLDINRIIEREARVISRATQRRLRRVGVTA